MAALDQDHWAERPGRTAPRAGPDMVERLVGGASVLGLAAIALVVILAWMLFAGGPRDVGVAEAPPSSIDQMAGQRIADIAAERQLNEARAAASSRPELIDAHVSAFQARRVP